ncbi:MAG: methyltransferase domain-containing protein [Pseudomonadota bacterium]
MKNKLSNLLNRYVNSQFKVAPLRDSQAAINDWYQTPLGQRIFAAEQLALDQIMPEMYGYHLMQLSVLSGIKLSNQSPITHHFSLGLDDKVSGKSLLEQLPIDAESIDTAILHHVLEYSDKPHQLLRETARTIIPNGYIVIVGFNPLSLFNLKKYCARLLSLRKHWRYQDLTSARIVDWLRLLDFEPVTLAYGYHALPLNRGYRANIDKIWSRVLPSTGTFYVIVSRKSVIPMTLMKKPWKKKPTFPHWATGSSVPRQPANTSLSGKIHH